MKVEVAIEASTLPRDEDLDNVRQAATRLTNNMDSISVETSREGDRVALTTRFTMKTTAQYKVVDGISKEFEFWTFDLAGYQTTSIEFPR